VASVQFCYFVKTFSGLPHVRVVHGSNPTWCLAVPRAVHNRLSIFFRTFKIQIWLMYVFCELTNFSVFRHLGDKIVWTLLGLTAVSIVQKPPKFQRHTPSPSSEKVNTFREDGDGVCLWNVGGFWTIDTAVQPEKSSYNQLFCWIPTTIVKLFYEQPASLWKEIKKIQNPVCRLFASNNRLSEPQYSWYPRALLTL
jgi:hypothetical protein